MARTAVSIVIPVWNLEQVTQACLDALAPTLGQDDQVVVVDNGSSDGTAALLAGYDWVEVVSHEQNLGFAGGCNAGAERARNPITVFLNNDTLPVGRWIEPLVAPFADPDVGATGPMSNFVSGSQLHEASYGAAVRGMKDVRRIAQAAMTEGRGRTWPTHRLVGFALALRTELFAQVGGFDESFETGGYEDDELCRRLQAAGARLLVVAGSYVYHLGHATFDGNGLDWAGIELRNRAVMLAKAQEIPVLSLVVDCADGFAESARSLVELVDLVRLQAQLVLVEHGDGVARSLAQQVSGDVVVVECPPDPGHPVDGVRRGLAAATGRRRVSVRSGEAVDAAALREFAADPSADFTARHVGTARLPVG
ncbi:MAG: glycosyltransferase family 2 protein [Micrococcales bacterium]|nr:glycosyltransferase family 2 protein [Micrococcales bacterium]